SLSYHLVTAMQAENTAANYASGYSPTRPVIFWMWPSNTFPRPGGLHLDPVCGLLSFIPTNVNNAGVFVIEIKEWRYINGQPEEIGSVKRDFQIIQIPCPNNDQPKFSDPKHQ